MNDLLKDLGQYLASAGAVSGDGVDLFRDALPDSPDNVVALFEYSGTGSQTGVMALERSVQVRVRNTSYAACKAKVWEIFRLLDRPLERIIEIPGGRWMVAYARQTPSKLQVDRNNRIEFSFNLGVTTYGD